MSSDWINAFESFSIVSIESHVAVFSLPIESLQPIFVFQNAKIIKRINQYHFAQIADRSTTRNI